MNVVPTIHLAHVLMLLQALETRRRDPDKSVEMPPEVFLLRDDGDSFWELVGLRLRGVDSLILAGVEFSRQAGGADSLSRQSLVSHLGSPPRSIGIAETPRPAHLLEVMLPDPRLPMLKLLERCREGEAFPTAFVDRDDVELAFDFRLENPSRLRRERSVASLEGRCLFRTAAGHVLSALPHRLPRKLHGDEAFLALRQVVQHTATDDYSLPTLVVHRRLLSMYAPQTGGLTTWLNRTLPFHVDLATSGHLLDPRLETYRTYRERLLEERAEARRTA